MVDEIAGRMRAGYQMDVARSTRRTRALAETFRPDERMDALMRLKDTHPADYATLSPSLKIAIGHYAQAKAAHAELTKGTTR